MERDYEILYETIKKVARIETMPGMLERAKAETGQNMVLTALRKKFKQIPPEIEESVLERSDPIALESLLEHVFDSDTLDEFETAL